MKKKNEEEKIKKISSKKLNVWLVSFVVLIATCVLILGFGYKNQIVEKFAGFNNGEIGGAQVKSFEEIAYWQSLIEKQTTYQRAYLELAIGYANVGDIINAKLYFESAVAIDPNNEDNKKVELFIQNKELSLDK